MSSSHDALDRRGALKCLGWAGTGALFTLSGGLASSVTLDQAMAAAPRTAAFRPLTFLQISDTHIGFNKAANPDPAASLRGLIAKIKALPHQPDLIVHTGDLTHLAKPEQFAMAQALLGDLSTPIRFIPGEHDIVDGNDPRPFLERFGLDAAPGGWWSFDLNGVHFIGLVNSVTLGDRGMGTLGADQLGWLRRDLAGRSASTPIVILSHFPLWDLYPDWGWGTQDGMAALALLRRFSSVTALNGHVHQVQRKLEGHISFHSARSTAYPQPAPGVGAGPGPLVVPPAELGSAIGFATLQATVVDAPIAITEVTAA